MSTLSLRKIKHDTSVIDNVTLNSNGTTTTGAELTVPSLKGASGNKLQLRSGDSSFGVSLQNISGVDLLAIDAVGRVTMPYQPAFSAKGSSATPNTVGAILQYDTVLVNVGGHYNTLTYRFTAPVSGNYRFSYNCLFNASTYLYASLYKNGAYVNGLGSIGCNQGAGVEQQSSCSVVASANANDFFDVRIWFFSRGYVGLYGDHAAFSGELIS